MKRYITYLFVVLLIGFVSCSKENTGGNTGGGTPTPTVEAPGVATLLTPVNNKTCEEVDASGQVTFTWSESTNTTKYDLKIINLDTNGTSSLTGITTTSKAVNLTKGAPYSWQITSKNTGTATTASALWKFYLAGDGVVNYAPFPADALTPKPGSTVTPTDGKVNISWKSTDVNGDPMTYTLYVDTVDGKQNSVVVENSSSASFNFTVIADTAYYWRVKTSDGLNSSTSMIYAFKTAN